MNFKEKINFFNQNATKTVRIKPTNTFQAKRKKIYSPSKKIKILKGVKTILVNGSDNLSHIRSNSFDSTYNDNDNNIDPLLSSILAENDIDHFDELKFVNRKYNKNNINNGKKFFKIRFIKKKLNKDKKKYSMEGQISKFDKDNNSLLHSKDFLLILEKSIFSFNQKNFKESYNILKNSEIINSIKEFGEFLLVVSGFDKYLIGEFLAKEKYPNEKGEVLKSFIGNIYMNNKNISLLECIRFLLSRINLPKDANLILVIMECFTNAFFKTNQNSEEFISIFGNNSDNIYLLISTLLALNTMFTRKDIKNMNSIKKDEFIKMNKSIDSKYLGKLYIELKNKPITMSDDYNEAIYQKLTPLILEKTNKNDINDTFLDNSGISITNKNNEKMELNIQENMNIQNFDTFTIKDEELLMKVNKFYKIRSASNPLLIYILINEDCTKLIWYKDLENFKDNKIIDLKDINDIYNGINITEHSLSIKKYIKANLNEEKYLNYFISIVYNNSKETFDLKSDNLEQAILWFKALKSLVNEININSVLTKLSQSDEKLKERENAIKEIWLKFIIPKWDKYGNYLLLKKLERSNYFNYLLYDQKMMQKNEQFDDIKFYKIKYINSFLESIKENKRDLELNEYYFLCNLGLPFSLRKKIYQIIIGNPCYVTNELYNSLKLKITDSKLNFEDLEKKYKSNKGKSKFYNENSNLNEIIKDIFEVNNNIFIIDLKKLNPNINKYSFMKSVYLIVKAFFLFRQDISYNKIIIEFIYLFLIINDSEEEAFISTINFFSKDNYIYLFMGDSELRKEITSNNVIYFANLIKNKLPNIEGHLNKMEILPELYFIDWMKHFFIETLDISIVLHIFDLFLLNGEYILFQTGLSILKILEHDLMNMSIGQVLKSLKRLPNKYNKEKFFDIFNNYNSIKYEYIKFKNNILINRQKRIFNEQK